MALAANRGRGENENDDDKNFAEWARGWAGREADMLATALSEVDALKARLAEAQRRMQQASQGLWEQPAVQILTLEELPPKAPEQGAQQGEARSDCVQGQGRGSAEMVAQPSAASAAAELDLVVVSLAPPTSSPGSSAAPEAADDGKLGMPTGGPETWPASVRIRASLAAAHGGLKERYRTRTKTSVFFEANSVVPARGSPAQRVLQTLASKAEATVASKFVAALARQMRNPHSMLSSCRSCLITTFLLYEVIVTPFVWGFDVPLEGWLVVQLFISAAFWSFDICWSLALARLRDVSEGDVVSSSDHTSRSLVRHYLKSGFPLDMLVVSLDLASGLMLVLVTAGDDFKTVARYLRLVRLLGMLRLRRLLKMLLVQVLRADVESPSSLALLVGSILSIMVMSNHIQACSWAFIGSYAPTDTGAHWMDMHVQVGEDTRPFRNMSLLYRYSAIFHWHMAQTTVGTSIHTASTVEKIANVVGLFVALLTACTVVSMLSANLVNYQILVQSRTQQLRTLRQYLLENDISSRIYALAVRQAGERIRKSRRLTEKNVQALSLLSTTLRSTVRYEVFLPFLQRNPILRLWTRLDTASATELCQVATDFEVMLPHEAVFPAAVLARRVFYLASGRGEYKQHPATSNVISERVVEVSDSQWLAGAALWCEWSHVGSCEAVAPCEMFSLDAQQWGEVLPRFHIMTDVVLEYGALFCKRVAGSIPPYAPWPDDLEVPFTESGHIVASMSAEMQEIIGLDALSDSTAAQKLSERQLERLKTQVLGGQCVVYLDASGALKRLTSGVSLEIQRPSDGKYLMQLGKVQDGVALPSVMVPGHKSERGELPNESAWRLARKKLRPLASHIQLQAPVEEKEMQMSREHGIYTEYVQMKFPAELDADHLIPSMFIYGQFPGKAGSPTSRPSQSNPVAKYLSLTSGNAAASQQKVVAPECLLFPVESGDTCYCFAWLTKAEFARIRASVKPTEVADWLQDIFCQWEMRQEFQSERQISSEFGSQMQEQSCTRSPCRLTPSRVVLPV